MTKKLSVVAGVVVLVVAGAAFSCSKALYFDYGVPGEDPGLKYPSPFWGGRPVDYQFVSTLMKVWDDDRKLRLKIQIDHLRRPYYKRVDYFESVIEIRVLRPEGVEIDPSSITLEHRTDEGTLLDPRDPGSGWGARRNFVESGYAVSFKKTYDAPLPKELRERIYLVVVLDGERIPVEYDLPLEYRLHYSWLDALMSV